MTPLQKDPKQLRTIDKRMVYKSDPKNCRPENLSPGELCRTFQRVNGSTSYPPNPELGEHRLDGSTGQRVNGSTSSTTKSGAETTPTDP